MRPTAQRQLKKINQVDLVIGLPSFKNPAMAAHVAGVALAGLHHYYPHLRAALINADAGQQAATRQAVAAVGRENGHQCAVVAGRYEGTLGRGNAIAAVLDAALALDAKAVVLLDSHTTSITPAWIPALASLVLENKADLVMPRYHWSLPEGALSDLIAYPLFRALWGRSVRHPAAPEFALSPQLANALLDADIWETEAATDGLSPWLTTHAIVTGWRVAQTALGHKQAAPPGGLTGKQELFDKNYFCNVVSMLLRLAYQHRDIWPEVTSFGMLSTLTRFASHPEQLKLAPAPEQDIAPLLDNLALGWIEHRALWRQILTDTNLSQIEALAALPPDRFYFPADLWARILFDFLVVFNKGEGDPYRVVDSLWPLYQGRLAAFWQEIAGLAVVGHEGTVAAQVAELEEARAYLKIRWHMYPPWQVDGDS